MEIDLEEWKLFVDVLIAYAWPLTIFLSILLIKKPLFEFLNSPREKTFRLGGAEMVIGELRKDGKITESEFKELEGLSSHDIWALEYYKHPKEERTNAQKNLPIKVAALSFEKRGLIVRTQSGFYELTRLGNAVLEKAKELTENE